MIMGFAALALVCGLGAAPTLAVVDLAGNNGFEIAGSGGAADSAKWNEFTSLAGNLSERSTVNPEFGSFSHHLKSIGTAALGTVAGVQQHSSNDAGLPSLTPGSTLSATFDAMTPFGPGGVMNYTLRILNRSGAIVGIYNNTIPSASNVYRTFTTPNLTVPAFGAAPNDFYASFFEVNAASGGFVGSTAEVYIDNVHIMGVPEPATMALLALGAAMFAKRRTR
jgi:hypothetical protein